MITTRGYFRIKGKNLPRLVNIFFDLTFRFMREPREGMSRKETMIEEIRETVITYARGR